MAVQRRPVRLEPGESSPNDFRFAIGEPLVIGMWNHDQVDLTRICIPQLHRAAQWSVPILRALDNQDRHRRRANCVKTGNGLPQIEAVPSLYPSKGRLNQRPRDPLRRPFGNAQLGANKVVRMADYAESRAYDG